MKKLKAKISVVFVILMIITSLISCKAFAEFLPESYVENTCTFKDSEDNWINATGSSGTPVHITYSNLKELWYLLCCQHGQKIGSNAYYNLKSVNTATPDAAYILNKIEENAEEYPTYIQQAWWSIKEGQESIGKSEDENDLKEGASKLIETAKAYEDFVKSIANNVDDTSTYRELTHTYSDGKQVTIKFPELDKEKLESMISFNDDKTGKLTVSFDEESQKYLIGPFSINYVEAKTNEVEFGNVENVNIYTNASSEPLSKDKWRFVWQDGQRQSDDTAEFPHPGEKFCIEVDYIEDATEITGIDFEYKYLIAGGEYLALEGSYTGNDSDDYKTTISTYTDENGNISTLTTYEPINKAQQLAMFNKSAMWYETIKVSSQVSQQSKHGSIEVTKKAVDENGKELSLAEVKDLFGEDQWFDFKIKVTHSNGDVERDTVTVRAGDTEKTRPFYWDENEQNPTYEVEEVTLRDNNSWEVLSIVNSTGTLNEGSTPTSVIAVNTAKARKEKISLTKKRSGNADQEENFYFDVKITNPNGKEVHKEAQITIPQGQEEGNTWTYEHSWYGEKEAEYEITEIMDKGDASKYQNSSITPNKGYLDGTKAVLDVHAYNFNDAHKANLVIKKELAEGQITEDTFEFHVRVEGLSNYENGILDTTIRVKPNEPYVFENLAWEGDVSPTYLVEETENSEIQSVNIEINGDETAKKTDKKVEGHLKDGGNVNIVGEVETKFVNNMVEHEGGVKVVKDIETTEKISKETLEAEGKKFEFEIAIAGTFKYQDTIFENSTKVISISLPDNGNWEYELSGIKWYGSTAPTFTVKETKMPTGWRTKSITYSDMESNPSSEGMSLVDKKVIEAKVINELPSDTLVDLTFTMGGIVWVDETLDEKNGADNGYYSAPNGVYDEGEILKENTEVTVYKVILDNAGNEVRRTVAKAYKDTENNEMVFPIITKTDGKWSVPRISVPAFTDEEKAQGYTSENGYKVSYDVEFIYDGQTYEPTEFLSYQLNSDGSKVKNEGDNNSRAQAYRNATTSQKDAYAKDSMAVENVLDSNKVITEISGKTVIDASGKTTGIAKLADGTEVEIQYESDNAGVGYPTISKLKTTDENGKVLDLFKTSASTLNGGLTFPLINDTYNGVAISDTDKYVDLADTTAQYENTTYVDDQGVHHRYKFIAVYNHCLNINLGLKEREAVDVGLSKNLDNAKVIVKENMYQYNYSGAFDLTEQKTNTLAKDIYVGNASENFEYTLGLYKSDYYYRAEMYVNGEDKTIYDALENFYKTLNKLPSDTEMDIYLTYKLKLQNGSSAYDVKINSIDDYSDKNLELVKVDETKYLKTKTTKKDGEQSINDNIVVANASDYSEKWQTVKTDIVGSDKDADGNNIIYNKMTATNLGIVLAPGESKEIIMTFKVNKDADNDNIVLGQKCNVAEIASYSSYVTGTQNYAGKIDRDSAPSNINIETYNEKAWYEDDTFAAPRLKVTLKGNERTINGLAWEDNSKDDNTVKPDERYNQLIGNGQKENGEETIEGLTTQLVEKVTVGDKTYDYIWPTSEILINEQTISELTGFNSTVKTDSDGKYNFVGMPTGDYSVKFTYGDEKIESKASYSESEFYNGQDFKSTQFNADLKETEKLTKDSYLDIAKVNNYSEVKNTAVDSELRRMQVIANSREITYANSSVMAKYEDELFENYYMFASTPKLDMNIEFAGAEFNDNDNTQYRYDVNNINFGLEERPATKLTLDKQIEEIILTTSDGTTIMDALYNINYVVNDAGDITATVELDTSNSYGIDNLQALNRDQATNQGFRYINVDSSILEGTTITVKYRFTVLNTGEVDRTGKLAEIDYSTDFDSIYEELSDSKEIGKYLGNIYYFGEGTDDAIVTTKVRQLVDYIDNDVSFSGMMNSTPNTSWSNITTSDLSELIDPQIIKDGIIVDDKDIQYETENRNNLVVSIDSTESELNNAKFIVDLKPYNADNENYSASMNLTVTRYVGSDSGDLQIDNIAEIIRYNNTVGRRNGLTIAGNQVPATALEKDVAITTPTTLSAGMLYESDTSVTEVITLAPPTGTGLMTWKLQVIGSVTLGLVIIAGGIVLIKKKVLK